MESASGRVPSDLGQPTVSDRWERLPGAIQRVADIGAWREGVALVAGVIGTSKFSYDLLGDTVNTASRMESSGEVGRIHVSDRVREALGDRFDFTARGELRIKRKGAMRTHFLEPPGTGV